MSHKVENQKQDSLAQERDAHTHTHTPGEGLRQPMHLHERMFICSYTNLSDKNQERVKKNVLLTEGVKS